MKKFIGYSIAIIGIIIVLFMIVAFLDPKTKSNAYLGLLIFIIAGGLLVNWGKNIIKAPELESPRAAEGYWKAKCGWYLLGGIALAGVAIVGWMTMPPAGFMGTLLSFKLFQGAYKAYYE